MATIAINILANARSAVAGIDSVNKKLGIMNGTAKRVGGALAGALAVGGVTVGLSAVKRGFDDVVRAGSSLQQSTGAIESVFGSQANAMKAYGATAAQNLGLSKNAYNELATVVGSGLKNNGIKDFAGETQNLIGIGADLSATYGGTTKDAVSALGAVMRGEYDSIEKYGVSMKQSDVNALLAARGQDKLTGSARKTAEAQAKLDIVTKQTSSSQGAFARESNTLAGAQQRNAAAFENMKAALGTALLPLLTRFQTFIAESLPGIIAFGKELGAKLAPAFTSLGQTLQGALPGALEFLKNTFTTLGTVIAVLAPIVVSVFTAFSENITIIKTLAVVLGVLAAGYQLVALQQTIMAAGGFLKFIVGVSSATKAWAAVQAVLNVVMSANPIGLVIIAIAALVAGIIYAYKHSETFRKIVHKAWEGIKAVSSAVFGWLKSFIPAVFNAVVSFARAYVNTLLSVVKAVWSALQSATRAAWTAIKDYVINPIKNLPATVRGIFESIRSAIASKVSDIKAKITEIKTNIVNAFTGLKDRMYSIGTDIIQGLINGIRNMIGAVTGIVGNLVDNIKSKITGALGINSPSRVFAEYGHNIGQGLLLGIKDEKRAIGREITDIGRTIEQGWTNPTLGINTSAPASRSSGTVILQNNQITVEVAAGTDAAQVGRELQGYLDAYARAAGRK